MNSFLCKRCEWLCSVGHGTEKFCYLSFSEESPANFVFSANGRLSKDFKIAQKCPYFLEHIVLSKEKP